MISPVTIKGIGIDITDIRRFKKLQRGERFIRTTFSAGECDYCFAYREPAPHLAGIFSAKEAVRKVYGDTPIALSAIEVRHRTSGKPEIWMKDKRVKTILVSISHTATLAIAVAYNQTT